MEVVRRPRRKRGLARLLVQPELCCCCYCCSSVRTDFVAFAELEAQLVDFFGDLLHSVASSRHLIDSIDSVTFAQVVIVRVSGSPAADWPAAWLLNPSTR